MWHLTPDTWHLTRDTWHLTCDTWWGVNILSKFQLPSSFGLGGKGIWRSGGKGSLTWSISEWITKVFIEQPRLHQVCEQYLIYIYPQIPERTKTNFWANLPEQLQQYYIPEHIYCVLYTHWARIGWFHTNSESFCHVDNKNPAYGRQRISRPMRIVGTIQFWKGCVIYVF